MNYEEGKVWAMLCKYKIYISLCIIRFPLKVEYSRDLLEIYHLNHKNLCCGHIVHPLAQVYSSETKENEVRRYLPYTMARCPASLSNYL